MISTTDCRRDLPVTTDSVSELLRRSLKANAEKIAIEDGGGRWSITYEQLSRRADLFRDAVSMISGAPLLLNMQKSPAYYGAVIGCFVHRISFCPIDLVNPINRIAEIAEQFGECAVLTDRSDRCVALQSLGLCSALVTQEGQLSASNFRREMGPSAPGDLQSVPFYYIATSGSTGKPKIVKIPHYNTRDFIAWAVPFYEIDALTRWAQFSSIGFDLSLVDILSVLIGGGTLVALSSRLDRTRPAAAIQRLSISHWHSVPSIIPYILAETGPVERDSSCRLFTFCGEPLAKADVEKLRVRFPMARIVNTYGPTEGTLFCSFHECSGFDPHHQIETIPIGVPICGWNFVYVDDVYGSRLVIVSNNVAEGYLGQDAHNFGTVDMFGTTLKAFDTGDYFTRIGSSVYFSHRRDGMVKISGNRVDLGEVEATAKRVGVTNPVAFYESGQLILVGEGLPQDSDAVRKGMANFLPSYCIPHKILFSDSHPRTPNGKIDRAAIRKENCSK